MCKRVAVKVSLTSSNKHLLLSKPLNTIFPIIHVSASSLSDIQPGFFEEFRQSGNLTQFPPMLELIVYALLYGVIQSCRAVCSCRRDVNARRSSNSEKGSLVFLRSLLDRAFIFCNT